MNTVYRRFLEAQYEAGMALARASDLLELTPVGPFPPQRYLATYHCKTLAKRNGEPVREVDRSVVGIWLNDNYLRAVNVLEALTWMEPRDVFHANIRCPALCVGDLRRGEPLVDVLHRVYDVISGAKWMPDEHDALNPIACAWARQHPERFPVDTRPLKRRKVRLRFNQAEQTGQAGQVDTQEALAS